ncbi:hypothetical protein F2P81_013504 [Scophthalmus maximus]|uniref:SH3 domain-containing protein n=1 Tax=Scophthalmus maximus TaxID=52904 RepID=A0A6A4SMP0_SCOMX|nr:hypothetical protein F2P81_013504 [Scophthalmus maximus]
MKSSVEQPAISQVDGDRSGLTPLLHRISAAHLPKSMSMTLFAGHPRTVVDPCDLCKVEVETGGLGQRAEVVGDPNGSRLIFSAEPGVSSGHQILTSPEMTHEVVISPGLPTPPLSPFRSARLPSGEVKVSEVNGSGPTTLSFGSYYGPSQSQEPDLEDSERWSAERLQLCVGKEESSDTDKDLFRLTPYGALPDWSEDVDKLSDLGKQQPQPKSIFDFEPGRCGTSESHSQASLVSELSRFEAELDSEIQGLERRLSQKKQHRGRVERLSPANENMEVLLKKEEKKMKAARAKFNFQAQSPKELTLQKGDIVYIHRKVLDYGEALALYNFNADLPVELSFRKGAIPNQAAPSNPRVNSLPQSDVPKKPSTTMVQRQPYKAVYNYKPQNSDELELREGDLVQVMEKCDDGWFVGTSERTRAFGTFPGNYVAPV